MKTCKSCKYFNEKSSGTSYVSYGDCDSDKLRYGEPNKNETDNLLFEDYECYGASLYVGKDFGCIHWKQKND